MSDRYFLKKSLDEMRNIRKYMRKPKNTCPVCENYMNHSIRRKCTCHDTECNHFNPTIYCKFLESFIDILDPS
jgi:hypothetical protein